MAVDLRDFFASMTGDVLATPARAQRIRIITVTAGHVRVQRLDAKSRRVDNVPLRVLIDVAARVHAGAHVPTSSITHSMNGPVAALLSAVPWITVDGRPQVARATPGQATGSAGAP
jgi:hypothetical protein